MVLVIVVLVLRVVVVYSLAWFLTEVARVFEFMSASASESSISPHQFSPSLSLHLSISLTLTLSRVFGLAAMVMLSSLKHGLHLESISIFCGASLWLNPSEKQKNKFKMGFHMSFLSRTFLFLVSTDKLCTALFRLVSMMG